MATGRSSWWRTAEWASLPNTSLTCLSAFTELTRPDRKSTRLNSSHANISYAVFYLKKNNESADAREVNRSESVIPGRVNLPLHRGLLSGIAAPHTPLERFAVYACVHDPFSLRCRHL